MSDDSYTAAETIASVVLGALISFAIAYWVWPWLGPQMFQPCPQFTSLGLGLYVGWNVVKTLARVNSQNEKRALRRRITRLEGRR